MGGFSRITDLSIKPAVPALAIADRVTMAAVRAAGVTPGIDGGLHPGELFEAEVADLVAFLPLPPPNRRGRPPWTVCRARPGPGRRSSGRPQQRDAEPYHIDDNHDIVLSVRAL